MKVQISFELDLEDIIDSNSHLWCYEGRDKEEIYQELKTIFGDNLDKGMSDDVRRVYKNTFPDIFNY
tara:strand:- start:1849 stop:2049 length:201 start_codon:yes stop_codon:yes gene_type:complete